MKKSFIWLCLSVLTISAFCIRLDNFRNSPARSIDETVYYRMAKQILKDPSDYNTIPYGKELAARGRPLPQYFFEPIFKHPPFFTMLCGLSMRVFGSTLQSAEYVSLLSAVLMIPLIYLLGMLIFNSNVGIMSAFFLWMDPVNIICSQKVWMDSMIAFFTLLAAVCFVYALKKEKDVFFILSGIVSGLAVNTKYTGILITVVFILYALIYRRDLFKNPSFNLSLILPIVMLIPWGILNYQVYGSELLARLGSGNNDVEGLQKVIFSKISLLRLGLIGVAGGLVLLFLRRVKSFSLTSDFLLLPSIILFSLFSFFFLSDSIIHSLQPQYLPSVSWRQGLFAGEPPWFYFKRLIEFSFLYFFSFAALFIYRSDGIKEAAIVRISAGVILVFFIAWGNYQSRYVLSSLPFLIILSVSSLAGIYDFLNKSSSVWINLFGRVFLLLLMTMIICKVAILNLFLSYPNDMCYF